MNIIRFSNTKDIDTSNGKQPVYDKDNNPVYVNGKHYTAYPTKKTSDDKPIYTNNIEMDIETDKPLPKDTSLSLDMLKSMSSEHGKLKLQSDIVYDLTSQYPRESVDPKSGAKTTFYRCYFKPHSDFKPFTSKLTLS
tara:strand:+ start:218 stop:628 length:411 start_codon:yes stop_codon:yes gene_type:complete